MEAEDVEKSRNLAHSLVVVSYAGLVQKDRW
jgi:hypothetical protein